jgi:peptide/nickel transport system substrate-binding protein
LRWRALALLAVFALVVAACSSDDSDDTTTTAAAEEETTTTAAPETTTTEATSTTEATVGDEAPVEGAVMSVTFSIEPDATWADGVPVSADDFAFTQETIMNPDNDILSRDGNDKVINVEVIDEKTVRFDFGEIYAPWQNLFSTAGSPILPKHELEGQDFNTYWRDSITLGSGPFVFDSWTKDQNIKLVRNPDYWRDTFIDGTPVGDVQEIIVPFIEDSQTQVQALRGGEVDMLYPQPQLDIVEQLRGIDGVTVEASAGTIWEHFDLNSSDPLLSQPFVRQAIAMGIDRASIVEAIVQPIVPEIQVLNNSIWLTNSPNYEDHFSQWGYDPDAAVALLEENGCTLGGSGIYECDGQPLSFTWTTTAGNEARELQFEIAQANLKDVGIEVTAKFGPASEVFADEFIYGNADQWQIFNFAWVGSPDPAGGNTLYYCEGDAPNGFGGNNNLRWCNEEADALVLSTDGIVDPTERAAVYNEADAIWLEDAPLIPLYQKPTVLGFNSNLSNLSDNPTQTGPLWNVETWSGQETITYGADQQPESFVPYSPDGNLFASNHLAEAVLQSAYKITPDFEYVPNLIADAQVTLYGE